MRWYLSLVTKLPYPLQVSLYRSYKRSLSVLVIPFIYYPDFATCSGYMNLRICKHLNQGVVYGPKHLILYLLTSSSTSSCHEHHLFQLPLCSVETKIETDGRSGHGRCHGCHVVMCPCVLSYHQVSRLSCVLSYHQVSRLSCVLSPSSHQEPVWRQCWNIGSDVLR